MPRIAHLRVWRVSKKWSREELAQASGVDMKIITSIEEDGRPVNEGIVEQLAQALSVNKERLKNETPMG